MAISAISTPLIDSAIFSLFGKKRASLFISYLLQVILLSIFVFLLVCCYREDVVALQNAFCFHECVKVSEFSLLGLYSNTFLGLFLGSS